ncbi:MAG: TetR/AcrR family transcriptional regulator [Bacillota bacterium]
MKDIGMRERIMSKAVELFSLRGYHGTSVRDIAREAECSLPMLYYYFNNKNDLYEEIVYSEFLRINESLKAELPTDKHIKDIYLEYILQRKRLTEYEKAVYKMALKAWMCIEGNEAIQLKLKKWEESRIEYTRKLLSRHWGHNIENDTLINVFVGMLENMINKIVLMDMDLAEEDIKKEIYCIFNMAQRTIENNNKQ